MSDENEFTVTNLGPIEALTVKLSAPGVTVLTAPNGSGKSILLDAMQSLAAGDGGLPLKDGAARGSIDGLGIHASILPKQTRCAGEFRIANLEGKLDLSQLVNPGVKDPEAADKRRIKALVGLSGVKADPGLFLARTEFDKETFERTVQMDTLKCDDLVEMAGKMARDYQTEARNWERSAKEDESKARALEPKEPLDTEAESDPEVLQQRFEEAHATYGQASGRCSMRDEYLKFASEAQVELDQLGALTHPTLEEAENGVAYYVEFFRAANQGVKDLQAQIAGLQDELEKARASVLKYRVEVEKAEAQRDLAKSNAESRVRCEQAILKYQQYEAPSDEELQVLKDAVSEARKAIEAGVRLRDTKLYAAQRQAFLESAASRMAQATQLRAAAAATDAVLSDVIHSDVFQVQQIGKDTRLMSWHVERGAWVPYHELSEAEKWRRAIDQGVALVGQGGLLFVRQEAWEGIDIWNRKEMHEYAVEQGVYILTAEATRDAAEGKEFHAVQYQG